MMKGSSSHWGSLGEAALHLVGYRQGGQEVFAAFSSVFACCKDCAQVVTRMAGLPPGKKAVVVVQVAHQGGIVEGCPVGSRLAPADQRNERITSKVLEVGSQHCERRSIKRSDGTPQGIQDADLEFLAGPLREGFLPGLHCEARKLLNLGHL